MREVDVRVVKRDALSGQRQKHAVAEGTCEKGRVGRVSRCLRCAHHRLAPACPPVHLFGRCSLPLAAWTIICATVHSQSPSLFSAGTPFTTISIPLLAAIVRVADARVGPALNTDGLNALRAMDLRLLACIVNVNEARMRMCEAYQAVCLGNVRKAVAHSLINLSSPYVRCPYTLFSWSMLAHTSLLSIRHGKATQGYAIAAIR